MKAIEYYEFGSTTVLQTTEQPRPAIKKDEVLVRVKAFSINPMDWKIRKGEMKLMSGKKFPKKTGADFSGTIEQIGSGVKDLVVGAEVFGVVNNIMKEGVSAEFIAIPSSLVWKKPDHVNFIQAASIPVVGTAAVTTFEKMGKIDSKTTILINGATGGFGMFLLQLLQPTGAHITAVTSPQAMGYAKKWGANSVVDYTKENVLAKQKTYDIVVDLSGKMGYKNARQIMNTQSIFINPIPEPIEIPLSFITNLFTRKKHMIMLSNPGSKYTHILLEAIDKGLDIEINKTFSFDQFREAYDYAEKGGFVGKVGIELQ